jgi:tetratricopeptide (TPR) repeat protein
MLTRALELDPKFGKALTTLGWCSYTAGKLEEAKAYYIRAAKSELWAFLPASFITFAKVRFALNETLKGCALLMRALVIEPDNPEIAPLADRYCTLPEDRKPTEPIE